MKLPSEMISQTHVSKSIGDIPQDSHKHYSSHVEYANSFTDEYLDIHLSQNWPDFKILLWPMQENYFPLRNNTTSLFAVIFSKHILYICKQYFQPSI